MKVVGDQIYELNFLSRQPESHNQRNSNCFFCLIKKKSHVGEIESAHASKVLLEIFLFFFSCVVQKVHLIMDSLWFVSFIN